LSEYKDIKYQTEGKYHPETDRNHTDHIPIYQDQEKTDPQLKEKLKLPE